MADIRAIDVSAWQESIDWKKVAGTGVKVAILRCTAGSSDLKVKVSTLRITMPEPSRMVSR